MASASLGNNIRLSVEFPISAFVVSIIYAKLESSVRRDIVMVQRTGATVLEQQVHIQFPFHTELRRLPHPRGIRELVLNVGLVRWFTAETPNSFANSSPITCHLNQHNST
jgi:hypothetical protein